MAGHKGAKIGYTQPKSTTYAVDLMMLEVAKVAPDQVELVRTGGFGEGLAALQSGIIDVAPATTMMLGANSDKYRAIAVVGEVLPQRFNVVLWRDRS